MPKQATSAEQLPTGVPRLDRVLGGGIPRGALVVIIGVPGSGKTTLAAQIAFAAAKRGQNALILTALSEPTNKLIAHIKPFDFYEPKLVGGAVQVLSLLQVLPEGLTATAEQILAMVRKFKTQLVVLDGFRGMYEGDAQVALQARAFLYRLGTTLDALGVTTIVTSEAEPHDPTLYPETTTADIIIGLNYHLFGARHRRDLEVIKVRGGVPLSGLHTFTISSVGATVYPQFEELMIADLASTTGAVSMQNTLASMRERVGFDIPELDGLLEGGVHRTTSTVLAGSLGTGKTLLALHFALAGVRRGEPVVYVSLREMRDQLEMAVEAFSIGPEFKQALADGTLTLLELPAININPDIFAERLLKTLEETQAQRLVIDSLAEIERAVSRGIDLREAGRLFGRAADHAASASDHRLARERNDEGDRTVARFFDRSAGGAGGKCAVVATGSLSWSAASRHFGAQAALFGT